MKKHMYFYGHDCGYLIDYWWQDTYVQKRNVCVNEKFIWADNNLEITHESNIYNFLYSAHAITFCGLAKEVKNGHLEETTTVWFSIAEYDTWHSWLKQNTENKRMGWPWRAIELC